MNSLRRIRARVRRIMLANTPGVQLGRNCQIHASASVDLTAGGTVVLGDDVNIGAGVIISPHGGHIAIGARTFVGPYCILYGHGGLEIGEDVLLAAQSVLIPANHTFANASVPIAQQPLTRRGIHVGDGVWIGCGVRILDGVRIGRGAVIGAGAVVRGELPTNSVAVGVPARIISSRV